jgi:leader peptidase (prepilin peptidase)/N-methyltransferase
VITIIIKGLLFAALLIYAAYSDIKRREVDEWVSISILIVSLIGTGGSFWGAVLTALPFFIPALLKSGSIGGGDIKLMFACGAVLGVWGGLGQTVIALTLVAVFSLGMLITKGFTAYKKTAIPLAPFLCAGGILSFILTNMGGI